MSIWDTLPEDSTYTDRGCVIHPSCLTCPLPVCALEARRVSPRADRTALHVLAYLEEGKTVREITEATGLSRRSVYRAKARIGSQVDEIELRAA